MKRLYFTGDISFGDNTNVESILSKEIKVFFNKSFLSVANFEFTLCFEQKEEKDETIVLKAKQEVLHFFTENNIYLVSLANNHVCDCGRENIGNIINILKNEKIEPIGAGKGSRNASKPFCLNIEKKQVRIYGGLLPFSFEDLSACISNNENEYTISTFENILKYNNIDKKVYNILLLHGGIQNIFFPHSEVRKTAHYLIERGFDLVLIHHSHVIQGREKYKNGIIYYGLGNFYFEPFLLNGKVIYGKKLKYWINKFSRVVELSYENEVGWSIDDYITYQKNNVVNLVDNLLMKIIVLILDFTAKSDFLSSVLYKVNYGYIVFKKLFITIFNFGNNINKKGIKYYYSKFSFNYLKARIKKLMVIK